MPRLLSLEWSYEKCYKNICSTRVDCFHRFLNQFLIAHVWRCHRTQLSVVYVRSSTDLCLSCALYERSLFELFCGVIVPWLWFFFCITCLICLLCDLFWHQFIHGPQYLGNHKPIRPLDLLFLFNTHNS